MANKKVLKDKQLLATLVTENRTACAFCRRDVDDEITYGKLYAIGDIQCHYFCALLSCCLVQKAKEEVGLFGFLYSDIIAEIERSKKHKCSYCNKEGANLGCCVSQCRKQFHLPCGREKKAVSLFYGTFKSYCQQHAPKQKIPDHVMEQAKPRMQRANRAMRKKGAEEVLDDGASCVCVICYERVAGFPRVDTFWPPCCGNDAWFHRACLQRMALSAGMHYLKCPLCNDKDTFYEAVMSQGYYVPDRDAAWELEQNAFADIYERSLSCVIDKCLCPMGRQHDSDSGLWDLRPCLLCGCSAAHAHCLSPSPAPPSPPSGPPSPSDPAPGPRYVCDDCAPAAPQGDGLDLLEKTIDEVIAAEERASRVRSGPLMPSRMSLRRTKRPENYYLPTTSRAETIANPGRNVSQTTASRLDLNLKPPRRLNHNQQTNYEIKPKEQTNESNDHLNIFSPMKVFEQSLQEKLKCMGVKEIDIEDKMVEKVASKFKKPRPLSAKRRIVNEILDSMLEDISKAVKPKEPLKEWCSPKKNYVEDEVQVQSPKRRYSLQLKKQKKIETIEDHTEQDNDENSNKEQHEKIVTEQERKDSDEENHDSSDIEIIDNIEAEDPKEPKCRIAFEEDTRSDSTFELPPEFISTQDSDDSMPFTNKTKTVDIEKDSSLEISEDNQTVNIDVLKTNSNSKKTTPSKKKTWTFKFSPLNKEVSTEENVLDVEDFKNHYLNEVDKDFKCKFSHKHADNNETPKKVSSAIDFAVKAFHESKKEEKRKKKLKRKLENQNGGTEKKKKHKDGIRLVCTNNATEEINLSIDNDRRLKKKKKHRDNIQVKIKWKKRELSLKIKEQKVESPKKLKQYVLKYSPEETNKMLTKPDIDVTPLKRKYIKQEKSPCDNKYKQMSIQSFFKKVDT